MLATNILQRVFIMIDKGQEIHLADPESTWSVEQVLHFYAQTYPILTTAKIGQPKIAHDQIVYRFESVMGTKG